MYRPLGISTAVLSKQFDPELLGEVALRGNTHLELFLTPSISYFNSDGALCALGEGIMSWTMMACASATSCPGRGSLIGGSSCACWTRSATRVH